jgi:SAM-dependent methyltransferase
MPSGATEDRNFDSELEYTFGYFPFLKPDNLLLTCLLQGLRPPADITRLDSPDHGITYCELGCGQGVTLNILATGDEGGRYYGVDYNPAQIANARALAEGAGLGNVEFIEDSFANLHQRDLPDFDFIVLHGIYSWISPALRQDIVDFIHRKLKPGGLCFISYNCTVARGSDLAFRQLLQAGLRREANPSPEGVAKSLAMADDLATKGARYFSQNGGTAYRLEDAKQRSPTYVFHEYFNPHWSPFFFHEVAADMAKAELGFVGSINMASNNLDLAIPATLRSAFDSMTTTADQELLKGIWANQTFRRDLFVKGPLQRLSLDEQVAALKALHFGLSRSRADCTLKVAVPAGNANLPDKPFATFLDAMAKAPVSGAALRNLLPEGQIGDRDFVRALIILAGAEYLDLYASPQAFAAAKPRFDQLNKAIGQCVTKGQDLFYAGTAKNRSALKLSLISYYLYRAHQTGPDDRASKAYRLLTEAGRPVIYKGQPVKDRKMAELVLTEHEKNFTQKILPKL